MDCHYPVDGSTVVGRAGGGGRQAIHWAARNGHQHICKWLVDMGAGTKWCPRNLGISECLAEVVAHRKTEPPDLFILDAKICVFWGQGLLVLRFIVDLFFFDL